LTTWDDDWFSDWGDDFYWDWDDDWHNWDDDWHSDHGRWWPEWHWGENDDDDEARHHVLSGSGSDAALISMSGDRKENHPNLHARF